jgi:hypothetical protein
VNRLQEASDKRGNNGNQLLLRKALDETIYSLGGPIHKTITWHMNNRGLLADPMRIDITAFYMNLKELVGPGADMIMEEAWQKLKKQYKGSLDFSTGTPVDRMKKMINSDEEVA